MGKVIRVKKGNQEFDVEEGKLQLALNDGFTPVKEEKVLTVVKGDKEFQVKESNLSAAMADGFKKKDATTPSQNGGEETSVTASETPSIKYEYNPLSTDQFNQPVIQTENGTSLPVNPKSIPVTPAINQKQYLQEVQQRIKTGTKTPQDETFIDNVKKANNVFGIDENETLTSIANKYDPQGQQIANLKIPDVIANFIPSLKDKTFGEAFNTPDGKLAIVEQLKNKINDESYLRYQNKRHSEDATVLAEKDEESKNDLRKLDYLKNTLTTEKQKTDIAPIFMDIAVRRDQSGNILKKAINRVVASTPAGAAAGGAALSMETEDRMERQPVEFSIGLNGLKYREPAQYERVMKMLNDGAPLSESMIANIVAQGADDKEAILKDQLTNGDITPQQFADENKKIQQVRVDNIVKNKEVYTAFVANGIANLADDVEQEKDKNNNNISGKIWGNRWNYTDEEIQKYGAAYIKANGLDPDSADAKYVIKYLQDNEGALIMENSIAKAGYVRDLAKGLAQPIRGIAATVEDLGKSNADIYTESMSQGNVNVSEERVSRIKTNPIENAVSDVLEGTGQFLTQAGLAAATSGALGMAAESLAASGLGATTAGETIGTAANIGNRLLSSKDAIATVVTAYAQSYDSNLKQALSYTADDGKAKLTANVMSGLEGATELFLSPLEIAQGIGNKLFNKKKISKGVVDILSDAAIVDKNAAIKNFLKASAKGVLETGKVAAAEIGEEEVTQIADYVSNAMLNPDSKSFKNRDLANEMVNTAYQTGLSMALPALVSGVGAFNVNNFSKGSLLIAAQNRQHIIDDMNQRLHNGEMTQDQYNEKATIVNTAANANQLLPVKDNGKKLNTEEKANYVYSRVSEAVLNRQLQKLMEDKSRDVGKIGEGEYATKVEDPEITQLKKKIEKQIEYRAAILQSKGVYVVNGERVDKAQLNEIIKSGDLSKYDISISNDDKLQNKVDELRKPKEPAVKPEVVAEETKIEVPVEGLGEFQEETVVVPKEEPLKANLQAAREQAAALPLEQQQKPTAEVAPLQSNLEAARQQGVVEESSATLADERAKQLLGQNAPQTTVAPKEQNLEAVRNQQVQKDLEEQQLANVANERVAQMALDKIPMTDAASKALAKMDKVKGKKLGIYRQIAQQNPKGFLKEIAQQARGVLAGGTKDSKTAMKEAVKNYTQDVVNEALAMFPEENKVIQNEPAKEEVKSSTTVSGGVGSVGVGGDVETKRQIENFGVNKDDVEPVHSVISQVFSGLKKAGLTTAKTVGDWVGIGKGSEKPYSLKIDGKEQKVKPVNVDVVNGFYSPLEKIITDSKFDKLPSKQWLEKYANSEEAKWTGLTDWLNSQTGSVSKADIQQYLKDNRIQVVEVVKADDTNSYSMERYDEWPKEVKKLSEKYGDDEDGFTDAMEKIGYEVDRDMDGSVLSFNKKGEDNKFDKATKFSQYQTEGEKTNYKEVLVTMPNSPISFSERQEFESLRNKRNYELTKEEQSRKEELVSKMKGETNFKSSHFDEPNILVHLRMNTRVDAEGNKVLFLEEVQSDWGQKGKREGFDNKQLETKRNELNDKIRALEMEHQSYTKRTKIANTGNASDYRLESTNEKRQKEIETEVGKLELEVKKINSQTGITPEAPFVTDTNAWTKLGLKVALKEAVKQGADKIAWTTGEQQNSRYDLSKQVDRIDVEKVEGQKDLFFVDITMPNGEVNYLEVENGKVRNDNSAYQGQRLDDLVGKDMAKKILTGESQTIKGEGLKVGGKGMKGFYGSPQEKSLGIVGNVAKSLFKQEPKTVEIKSGNGSVTESDARKGTPLTKAEAKEFYYNNTGTKNGYLYAIKENGQVERLDTLADINNTSPYDNLVKVIPKENSTQHAIDITPELKASVEGGQPLFKDAEAQYRIESGKNIVEAIKDFNGSPRATVALTHEIMHPTVVAIIDGAKEGNAVGKKHTETIVNEFNKANPNNKVTTEDLIKGNDAFKDGTTSKQYRAVQEFIAKSWEKYHREGGKGFSESFQKVLDQITQAFKSVYQSIKGKDVTPELRKMFDEILGKEAVEQSLKETPKSENKPIQNDPIKEGVESNQLPKIETTERDKRLFSDIASALSVVGQKNKESAIESLYAGRKAKYSKEEVDAAIAINKDFEKIVADMQKDELLSKECKT